MLRSLAALLPVLVVVYTAGWGGTFAGGAEAGRAGLAYLLLLFTAALAGRRWRDPLRLGRPGAFLLPALLITALLVTVAASFLASPVARAGRVGLVLLPAFLLLPAAIEACWAGRRRLHLGSRALALAYLALSLWSLLAWRVHGTDGASLPLGHHSFLALWLVTLLPLALQAREPSGLWAWVAPLAALSGLAAVAASRSLAGALALAAMAAAWILTGPAERRRWALPALLPALLLAPRLLALGSDSSLAARLAYWRAGLDGIASRPGLGRGPGSTAWTLGERLEPLAGVHPAGQTVSDLHSLPLQLAYELGLAGSLLAAGLALAWLRARRREAGTASNPGLLRAGLLGLLGFAVAALFGAPLSVLALPVAAALVCGACQAAGRPPGKRARSRRGRILSRVPSLYAAGALVLLAPAFRAQLAYERSLAASGVEERREHLRRAVELDPTFPLYRARLAWLAGRQGEGGRAAAAQALAAARSARGLAALYLVAGLSAERAGEPWAAAALEEACRLDPLGAITPFRLALAAPDDPRAVERLGRALVAEPRLAAAIGWRDRHRLLTEAVRRVERVAALETGWRSRFAREVLAARGLGRQASNARARLVLEMDAEAATSLSLHAFRRPPRPLRLVEVELATEVLARLDLPPPGGAPLDPRWLSGTPGCGLP